MSTYNSSFKYRFRPLVIIWFVSLDFFSRFLSFHFEFNLYFRYSTIFQKTFLLKWKQTPQTTLHLTGHTIYLYTLLKQPNKINETEKTHYSYSKSYASSSRNCLENAQHTIANGSKRASIVCVCVRWWERSTIKMGNDALSIIILLIAYASCI